MALALEKPIKKISIINFFICFNSFGTIPKIYKLGKSQRFPKGTSPCDIDFDNYAGIEVDEDYDFKNNLKITR